MKLKNLEKIFFFLTLLFLPTQLGRHFWPNFSFVYSLPIDYLSPTIYFWDLLSLVLWSVFLIQKKHINKLALNLFYFFILTQTVSLLSTGANIGVGLVRLEQYLIAGFFGVYIASQNFKEVRQIIFWGLAIPTIGESVLAFGQFLKGSSLGFWIFGERSFSLSTPGIAKFDFYGREFLRPYGTFPHPNVLAGFMIIVSILIRKKTVSFFSGLATLLTFSRTVIFAGVIFAFLLTKKQGKLLLILGVLILLPILYTRYSSLLNFDNLAVIRREELSITAFTLWSQSPILGKGLNNFIPSGADLLLAGPSRFLQPAHNIFLLALSETGIVGLMGIIILFGYPILKLIPVHRPSGSKPFTLTPMLMVWTSIIFLGLFDHYFLTLPQGYRVLFLVWGLSLSMLE